MVRSIADMAEKVRGGAVSAQSLVERAFESAEESAPINAFVTLDRRAALADARRIDEVVARGDDPGRLTGVPLAIKDNINVEGLRTTAGTPGIDYIATTSAPVVSRLKSEGAIIVGKTNMHELAFGVTSNNAAFGAVRNPVDPARSPGGSSGGTAAAVAAGTVPGGLGTDTAGSVRIPAALTGVVGFRPTTWRVDQTGIVPSVPTFDVAGPIARTVGDASLLNAVMTDQQLPERRALAGIRLGLAKPYMDNLSAGVSAALSNALIRIERAGASLADVDITPISTASFEVGFPIGFHEMKTAMVAFLAHYLPETSLQDMVAKIASKDVKKTYVEAVLGEGAPTEADYRRAIARIGDIRRAYLDLLETHGLDAIAFPTAPLEAPPIEGSDDTVTLNGESVPTLPTFMRNVAATGVYGAPGLTLPIEMAGEDVLPVGLEIDGRPDADLDLLGIGLGLESALMPGCA